MVRSNLLALILLGLLFCILAQGRTAHDSWLDSTHIVKVEIVETDTCEWRYSSPDSEKRIINGGFRLLEVIRGDIDCCNENFNYTFEQSRGTGSRISAPEGIWSSVSIDPGTTMILFMSSISIKAPDIQLSNFSILAVVEAVQIENELRLVECAKKEKWSVNKLLSSALEEGIKPGSLLSTACAEFMMDTESVDKLEFEAFILRIDDPSVPVLWRSQFILEISNLALFRGYHERWRTASLVASGLRTAAESPESAFTSSFMNTYFPNLIGLSGSAPEVSLLELFEQYPVELIIARGLCCGSEANYSKIICELINQDTK